MRILKSVSHDQSNLNLIYHLNVSRVCYTFRREETDEEYVVGTTFIIGLKIKIFFLITHTRFSSPYDMYFRFHTNATVSFNFHSNV